MFEVFSHDKEESVINNQLKVKIGFRVQMKNDFKHFSLLHVQQNINHWGVIDVGNI